MLSWQVLLPLTSVNFTFLFLPLFFLLCSDLFVFLVLSTSALAKRKLAQILEHDDQ